MTNQPNVRNIDLAARINSIMDEVGQNETVETAGNTISVRAPSGDSYPLTVDGPMAIGDVLNRLNLTITANSEYWVNSVKVGTDYQVSPGTTITIVGGTVKGG